MDPTREILEVLYREAELLDEGRYREWLALTTEDVVYQVPVRLTRERPPEGGYGGVSPSMYHLDEDRTSLEMRVARLETGFAWAEDPPSRLRHFVSNVRVGLPQETARGTEVEVRSNLLLFRSRWDRPEFTLLSAERRDLWRRQEDGWRLARRLVILDHSTLPTHNLSFFL
ncbi:Naphthalene dioxygenase small subunit [Thermus sp. CCB_US3_UF1]|uniref:aromatic-ring-hydroxylating dioxygenase subunit beta n=2 Tax=Thermus TaxID=270 RepID=UPI00023895D7|nr:MULTISPECIES: aromatic-ring-hydroxylating dioxygenase subunit beta [unclassified Thermus]AEV16358.1 Naphthalene dioxygenase small subunit [Thermus sp. CCB_US3_UF1]MCS6868139.1 aromatic-ring-hydroxylating dioxygenase subunit beta [Thermus sp.]MCX7849458.1 aromatic-ring-hydroxylating dioxygenase subunit beta [Thermus sp.]MDW8018353.1 aromatic-ring-hydroxylating dioxygenase subunit beta [Thermus sp.]